MVFISYRWESDEHKARVLDFANELKSLEIAVVFDQFQDQQHGAPDIGWPQWCSECIQEAPCVVIVATAGWFQSFKKKNEDQGQGSACEAHIVRQEIYNLSHRNPKYRLIHFEDLEAKDIPTELQAWGCTDWRDSSQQSSLVNWIKNTTAAATSGNTNTSFLPWPFADHEDARDQLAKLFISESKLGGVFLKGESECGKTSITKHLNQVAMDYDWLHAGRLDFKGGTDFDAELDALSIQFDLADRERFGSDRDQLRRLCGQIIDQSRPTLLIFDTYEAIAGNDLAKWIESLLLLQISKCPHLRIVIAGKSVPDASSTVWSKKFASIQLRKPEVHHWVSLAQTRSVDQEFVQRAYELANGKPSVLAGLFTNQS